MSARAWQQRRGGAYSTKGAWPSPCDRANCGASSARGTLGCWCAGNPLHIHVQPLLEAPAYLAKLPEPGPAHQYPTDTEARAAHAIGGHTKRLREKVLSILRENPAGLTDDEGGAILGGDRLDFGRRRNELARAGLVYDTGYRRMTPRRHKAIVWSAC